MDVTQEDRDAAARYDAISPYADDAEFDAVFAAHRRAALLEGVRIGLAAAREVARDAALDCWEHGAKPENYSYRILALDPATVLARHGGA